MRYLTVIILAISLALGVSGCNNGQLALKGRALEFVHNAMDTNASITYMTPIMQDSMKTILGGDPAFTSSGAGFTMPGATSQLQRCGKDALSKVTDANLDVLVKSKWGQVTVSVTMPYGQVPIKTTWIRIKNVWYIYGGSGGEVNEYGEAPYFVS